MNENSVTSKKVNLSKKLLLAWLGVAVILILVAAFSVVKYSGYKKAQETAVTLTLASTNEFNSYKNDYKKLVKKMYDFFNPIHMNMTVQGIKFDNSDVVSAARKADQALGKLMTQAGYDCSYGSKYLKYIGFIDYTNHNTMTPWIVWSGLAVLLLLVNLWCAFDAKKAMIIDGDRIICKNGKKTVKEFWVRDVKTVELAPVKGLKVRGNSINYRINLLANADEIKTAIMDYLSVLPVETTTNPEVSQPVQPSNVDELKKYKELLDSGVITQEDFDAKKKQLLGL